MQDAPHTEQELLAQLHELRQRVAQLEQENNEFRSAQQVPRPEKGEPSGREVQYATLYNTMAHGVVYQAADGRIIDANPAAEKILGLSLAQMKDRTSSDHHWKAIREDGSDFPGAEHPSMVALATGSEVRDVVMGVFHPALETYRWINIQAILSSSLEIKLLFRCIRHLPT